MTQENIEKLIRECMHEAQKAIDSGNPPFGCVIADKDGNIKAQAHNNQQSANDPAGHAEINAMRKLGNDLQSRYLDGYVMFANASSCSMCMSGALKAHITDFYFGAPAEASMDPWITMDDIAAKSMRAVEINGPILGDECASQIAQGRAVNS